MIELRGVTLTYPGPPQVTALCPTDLIISSGEYTTIMGPSGSGKSTLLNVLGLLDQVTSGSYILDGAATETLSDDARAVLRGRHIGFVFQAFHLMGLRTSAENVELSMMYAGVPRRERRERALDALERVGLQHRAYSIASRLSGGERQRVAIARALAVRPSVLLCDEPTGNLDSRNATAVLDLLDELHESGSTLIVITHDSVVAARGQTRHEIIDGQLT